MSRGTRGRWIVGAVSALAVVLAGCSEGKPGKEAASESAAAPVDATRRPAAPAAAPGAGKSSVAGGGNVAVQALKVEISNTLQQPMKVSAVMGSRTQPLGTVAPGENARFTVQRPRGAGLQIMASGGTSGRQVQAALMAAGEVYHFVIR